MYWRAALIALAAGGALTPVLPPPLIERVYSKGAYGILQPVLTTVSNLTRFALLDGLVIGLAALWLVQAVRDIVSRRPISKKFATIATRTAVWCAVLYLCFLVSWGFNYRRVPMIDKLGFRGEAVTSSAARAMAVAAVDEVNLLYETAHAAPSGGDDGTGALAEGLWRALELLGSQGRAAVVIPRAKRTLFDWYFKRAGVSGMTDPYFLEAVIASDVLPFERPFVLAHEWSHVAGIANEGEANFVGWLACVRASPGDRYSGWLFLYQELLPSLAAKDRATVSSRLAPGPRLDLRASRDRLLRNVNPRVTA